MSADWIAALTRPRFDALAQRLLCGTRLVAGGHAHRLTEIEIYHHGPGHSDPFAHRDPLQRTRGHWYLHRHGGTVRGGTFKGLDLTFGEVAPETVEHGGALIRGLVDERDRLIDGPSLCVDHLLRLTGMRTVAELDAALEGRLAWDDQSPLRLSWSAEEPRAMLSTVRVGLSLKRTGVTDETIDFLLRRYRFLGEPRRIRKGKPQMILALLEDGVGVEAIRERLGVTSAMVARWLDAYRSGCALSGCALGDLAVDGVATPLSLARLCGAWSISRGRSV